jgi:hypothetical protein
MTGSGCETQEPVRCEGIRLNAPEYHPRTRTAMHDSRDTFEPRTRRSTLDP